MRGSYGAWWTGALVVAMKSSAANATEYEFSLRFDISAVGCRPEECVERLAECGCDDAVVGIGIPGRIALEFTRESATAEDGLLSAIGDVIRALPTARLIEAAPDFVGYSDVAEIVGKSRQNMRKVLLSPGIPGPVPIHEGAAAIWHLSPVLRWLRDEKAYPIQRGLLELADATMGVNIAVTQADLSPARRRRIRSVLQAGKTRTPTGTQAQT